MATVANDTGISARSLRISRLEDLQIEAVGREENGTSHTKCPFLAGPDRTETAVIASRSRRDVVNVEAQG